MANLADLESALVKADAAGDADGARILAAEVRKMRSTEGAPVAQGQSMLSQIPRQLGLTARAGIKGLTALPAMVGDAMGMDSSGAVSRLSDMVGLPKPENATERVAGDVAGALAGTGGVARLGHGMMQAASPMASSIGNVLQSSLGSQALASVGGAGGAGVAREQGAGSGGQLAAGIAGSLAPGAAQGMAARVISPNVRPQVRTLMNEGVTPTVGQLMGGRTQVLEDKLTSTPILGDAIVNAKTAGLNQFNRALYQRALAPIGGDASNFPVGREGLGRVRDALSNAYDDVLSRVTPVIDQQFVHDITRIRNTAMLTRPMREQLDQVIENQFAAKMAGQVTGQTAKEIESELSRLARGYRRDPSIDARNLGQALEQMRGSMRQMLIRSNPNEAQALQAVDTGYANYVRLRDAASRVGAREGVISPDHLRSAVRNQETSVAHGDFATGRAHMQDMSDAGVNVMGSKYPDSGTAGRIGVGALTAGLTGAVSPGALMGIGAASVPYLPGVRQGLAALMTQRPQVAGPIADFMRPDSGAAIRGLLSMPYMQGQ